MANRPRIAFCFSWQARTLDQTYLFFQKNLFDAAKGQWFDYDIFCAVEDDEDVDKVNLLNPTKVEKIKSSDVEKIIEEKYWDFIKDDWNKYYLMNCDFSIFLQQIYKVSKSISMVNNVDYKLVLRLRFDVFFFNKLNFFEIIKEINSWYIICNFPRKTKKFWIDFSKLREIEDFYFIWTEKSLLCLTSIFENVKIFLESYKVKDRYMFILKINKIIVNTLIKINKRIWYIVSVVLACISKKFFFYWFSPESYYYEYLLLNWWKIKKTNISLILLRKNIEDSQIQLHKKTLYEFWQFIF